MAYSHRKMQNFIKKTSKWKYIPLGRHKKGIFAWENTKNVGFILLILDDVRPTFNSDISEKLPPLHWGLEIPKSKLGHFWKINSPRPILSQIFLCVLVTKDT